MRARRFLFLLAAVGGMLAVPAAAHADPAPTPTAGYPIEPPASAVSDATVTEGQAVIFSGRGFLPGEPISINVSYQESGAALHSTDHVTFIGAAYKTVHATSAGTFATSVRLSRSGLATLTATGAISHVTVTQQVHAVVGGSAGSLAVTGQSGRHWATVLAVGLGATLVGSLLALAALLLRGRRPRQT
jgi:hypothetical protein